MTREDPAPNESSAANDQAAASGSPAANDPAAIEVAGVEQSYDDEPVLEGVDATVAPGELVGLVGPNGAGKTTLLRTISGALDPDVGTVRVAGGGPKQELEDVQTLSSAAASRRIAVVPQTTRLSFAFSVRELVEMGRHPHRSRFQPPTREDRELVEAAMERTRTAEFADRSVEAVSGGERQRVLLARAIAQDAPVLLLDEPTANLDLNHAVETMSLVRELIEEAETAALAAIHDLELAARFCDRLLVLADCEIVADGPPAAVLDAEGLGAAFDARVAVEPSPIDGGVTIRAMDDPEIDARVHVVGGGEPAAAALGRLGEAGADLSLGPVPEGDRAVSTAGAFDAETVTTEPFSSVDSPTLERARDLAAAAGATVLAAERIETDGAGWLECCDAADGVVVLEAAAVEGGAEDSVAEGETNAEAEDAAPLLERAPTTDLDSLPGAVAAVAARDAAADRETRHRDQSAATLADGGLDGDSA